MSKNLSKKIVLATRESPLALWQAHFIANQLRNLYPNLDVELSPMTTKGDQILDKTLNKIGGKGLFIKELEISLLNQEADFAVHSMKDVPMELDSQFTIASITERESPFDAFVSNHFENLKSLPDGSKVGTSSLRRASQIQHYFPNLQILPLRGNVGTRLRKLDEGEFDAIILASAGLIRLELKDRIKSLLNIEESIPAVGQGALGLECLGNRQDIIDLLKPLNHAETNFCVRAERAVSQVLGGSCQVPLGAFATVNTIYNNSYDISMLGFVASSDGKTMIKSELNQGIESVEDAINLGKSLAEDLISKGAKSVLESIS